MPREISVIEAPAIGGKITDRPPSQLQPTEVSELSDAAIIDGVLSQTGGWAYVGSEDPFTSSENLAACAAFSFDGGTTRTYWICHVDGEMGIANSSGAGAVRAVDNEHHHRAVTYYPREFANGEAVLCPQDGVSPILRWSGKIGAGTDAGTITWNKGNQYVTGSGTTFAVDDVGRYLGIEGSSAPQPVARIVGFQSTTSISVPVPNERANVSGASWERRDVGVCGLMTLVTDLGQASSSGTTATGTGTAWDSDQVPRRYGQPRAFDTILKANGSVSFAAAEQVVSVASDTSLTMRGTPSTVLSNSYVLLRPLVGKEARQHQGRLWVTGVSWAPNRVYYTRPFSDADLGVQGNGNDSLDVAAYDALRADFIDVPDPYAAGEIVALASTPVGLAVFRRDSVYLISGEPTTQLTPRKIADVGCMDIRAMVQYRGAVYFADENGVYRLIGGQVENLTAQRREDEWRRLEPVTAIMGAARGHLIIQPLSSSHDPLKELAWRYDTTRDIWMGDWFYNRPRIGYLYSSHIPGNEETVLSVGAGAGGFGVAQESTKTQIADLGSTFTSDEAFSNRGSFFARFPQPLTNRAQIVKRVLESKVLYSLDRDGEASPAFFMGTAVDGEGIGRITNGLTANSENYNPGTTSGGTGVSFALTFPLSFGGSPSSFLTCANAGNAVSSPTYTITGPATNPRITNETTGDFLEASLTLADSAVLVIDTATGTVTVDGVASSAVTTNRALWPKLQPGSNQIRCTGSGFGDNSNCKVDWLDAYGG